MIGRHDSGEPGRFGKGAVVEHLRGPELFQHGRIADLRFGHRFFPASCPKDVRRPYPGEAGTSRAVPPRREELLARRLGPVPRRDGDHLGRSDGDLGRSRVQRDEASRLTRDRCRPAQQISLAEIDPALDQGVEIAVVLDPFGDRLGSDATAERDERFDQRLLRNAVLVSDARDDLAVDLDDRRLQGGDDVEAGVAGAGVVDGEAEAQPAQRLYLLLERRNVGDRLLLGALDDYLVRGEAGLAYPYQIIVE